MEREKDLEVVETKVIEEKQGKIKALTSKLKNIRPKKKYIIIAVIVIFILMCKRRKPLKFTGSDYSIPVLDLSQMPEKIKGTKYEYLYTLSTVDASKDYMAHPDSVLLKNGNILTMYPAGHGKGAVLTKISTDGGVTWAESLENTPNSFISSFCFTASSTPRPRLP